MANKPIIPFNPNGPVLSGSNDTSDTKPYVGKPKPMPPTTRPPGMGYSPSGGSFDASSLRRAPRPTMILPGQGQGPMPVGTKPLPTPNVNQRPYNPKPGDGGVDPNMYDERGNIIGRSFIGLPSDGRLGNVNQKPNSSGGGLEDWIKNHPNGQIYDEGPWGGGRPKADMGDNRLYRDPSTQPGNPEFRNFRGDMGMIRDGGQWGQRWQPGLSGNGEYAGVTTPGSWVDNGDPNAPQMRAMGGQGGPRDNANYGWSIGQTIGAKPHWNGPPGTEPSGNWGPGGESVAPGMGMPTQYGGGPSGRGGVEVPYDGMNGAVQRGPGAPGMPSGGKPPQGQQPGMPSQGGGRQPLRPGMEYRPGGGQRPQRPQQGGGANPQAMQQGAQALYSDNTIPHEFKGQLLQAAQSGNAQAFNEMLFNSNIPHETKLKLQQMFGYGGQQSATPDQGQQQNPYQDVVNSARDAYNASKGSPYYGAF